MNAMLEMEDVVKFAITHWVTTDAHAMMVFSCNMMVSVALVIMIHISFVFCNVDHDTGTCALVVDDKAM